MARDPREYYRYVVESKSTREAYSLQEYFREEAGQVSYERALAAWAAALPGTAGRFFRLYVHVPFCRSRCRFCMYESDALGRSGVPAAWLDHLAACAAALSTTFRGTVFSEVYMGGGTPSLLTPRQMSSLFATLEGAFRAAEGRAFSFEMDPRHVTRAKARVLKRAGCTRVSLGVQSLSRRELITAGRGHQSFAQVREAVAVLREEGIPHVNCDLILGLVGASARSVLDGVARVAALEPTAVTLYNLKPQANLPYLEEAGRDFYGGRARLEREVEEGLREIGARLGMVVSGNEFGRSLIRPHAGAGLSAAFTPVGETEKWVLGLGRYSISFAGGAFQYQDVSRTFAFDPAAPTLNLLEFDREDRIANLAIQSYCMDGLLSAAPLLERYGVRAEEHFRPGLALLRAQGRARAEEAGIRLLGRTPDERMTDLLLLLDHGRGRALRRFLERRRHKDSTRPR